MIPEATGSCSPRRGVAQRVVSLETHSTGSQGMLASVRYVRRVRTVGGVKPAASCSTEHESGSSPYIATYIFYK
ncbi:DUF3455 domain-containing protein [Paraburkholderia silvatlantica]|uniref:Uncharacterized protein n=1 Tax=Paraburkholderia silvatlantica TaxID=321895 RepID=A0ABR6FIA9_9BURK|nr:DUF3455 domain-containing protein [Paraburkholderia silvatlantica]MBB2926520.1 hypothetical protein [Paraburkholderia silvatlantica]PVY37839.1 uncharacterized protein DUF3455 [Paraburkholderia silvatlantica]PXW42803.1 uncharacterized protein DUF3455 [Paraburkholderia silvatlantica]